MSDDTHPNAHFDGPDDDIHGKIKHYMGKAYLAVEAMHKDMTGWFLVIIFLQLLNLWSGA